MSVPRSAISTSEKVDQLKILSRKFMEENCFFNWCYFKQALPALVIQCSYNKQQKG